MEILESCTSLLRGVFTELDLFLARGLDGRKLLRNIREPYRIKPSGELLSITIVSLLTVKWLAPSCPPGLESSSRRVR